MNRLEEDGFVPTLVLQSTSAVELFARDFGSVNCLHPIILAGNFEVQGD